MLNPTKEQEHVLDKIINDLNNEPSHSLICGDTSTGKTNLASLLKKQLVDYNVILLTPYVVKNEDEFTNLYSYFDISYQSIFEQITIKLNNKKICIKYTNYESDNLHPSLQTKENKMNYIFTPMLGTLERENIFSKAIYPKENDLITTFVNNKPDLSKNILLIDNVNFLNVKILKYIENSLRLAFNNDKFFGGLNTILLGNYFLDETSNSIFDLINFNKNERQFLKKYKYYKLEKFIDVSKHNMINYLPKFKSEKIIDFQELNLFINNDTDRSNLLYNKFSTEPTLYVSNLIHEINNFNKRKNFDVKQYDTKTNESTFYVIESNDFTDFKYYKSLEPKIRDLYQYKCEEVLTLRKNTKIIFIISLKDIGIKKGSIGYIKKIKCDKSNFVIDRQTQDDGSVHIYKKIQAIKVQGIIVHVEGKDYSIDLYNEKHYIANSKILLLERKQFPFKLGWATHYNFLKFIPVINNLVVMLNNTFRYDMLKTCMMKCKTINNIGFVNAVLLTNFDLLNKSIIRKKKELKFDELLKKTNIE